MHQVITFNKIKRSITASTNSEQILATFKWIALYLETFNGKEDANFLRKKAVEKLNELDNLNE